MSRDVYGYIYVSLSPSSLSAPHGSDAGGSRRAAGVSRGFLGGLTTYGFLFSPTFQPADLTTFLNLLSTTRHNLQVIAHGRRRPAQPCSITQTHPSQSSQSTQCPINVPARQMVRFKTRIRNAHHWPQAFLLHTRMASMADVTAS